MDDHRDDVDTWLHAQIDPLPPPPGTFELIRRRARRRRYRRAAASAAVVAAVIAAIIVVPRMTSVLNITQNQATGAANGNAAAPRSSASPSALGPGRPGAGTAGGGSPAPAGGGAAVPPVPLDFAATSVTFVGLRTGWVIGQAGAPDRPCSTKYCTSVARTDDAGRTWFGVPAPLTGAPDGSSGVSQIRFLNTSDGWAFGPELFATHDGGQHWAKIPTGGRRVTDLETAGDRAFAVFASCGGTGAGFAARCTSFSLYSAMAGNNNWAAVPRPVTGLGDSGRAASASLVLAGSRSYLLAPGGRLYAGPTGGGPWQQAGPGPAGGAGCSTGAAQQDGQPSGAMLAAASSSDLVLVCATGSGTSSAQVFTSANGGTTWQQAGTAPGGGTITSVAAQPGGEIMIATTGGIDTSHDDGASWQRLEQGTAGPAGGFSYVGMTSPAQGVAVPADPAEHAVWLTFDGGGSWRRSDIRS